MPGDDDRRSLAQLEADLEKLVDAHYRGVIATEKAKPVFDCYRGAIARARKADSLETEAKSLLGHASMRLAKDERDKAEAARKETESAARYYVAAISRDDVNGSTQLADFCLDCGIGSDQLSVDMQIVRRVGEIHANIAKLPELRAQRHDACEEFQRKQKEWETFQRESLRVRNTLGGQAGALPELLRELSELKQQRDFLFDTSTSPPQLWAARASG
jgi:hypothetical protein